MVNQQNKHLLIEVKLARQEVEVVTGKPRYDSKSKGLVENALHSVQCSLRTSVALASVEKQYHTTLRPSTPRVQWGVRHCGWSLARHTISEDGVTPY